MSYPNVAQRYRVLAATLAGVTVLVAILGWFVYEDAPASVPSVP